MGEFTAIGTNLCNTGGADPGTFNYTTNDAHFLPPGVTYTTGVFHNHQFRPPIALRTDLSHITTELWEIPVLRMAH